MKASSLALLCASASMWLIPAAAAATPFWDVHLAWNAGSNHTAYELQRALNGADFALLATPAADASSYVDARVPAGSTVRYRIRATRGALTADWSPEASGTVPALEEPPAPVGPTGPDKLELQITPAADTPIGPGIRIEAETGTLTGGAIAVTDAASPIRYVALNAKGDTVTFSVNVPAGEYMVRARLLAPNLQSDSVFIAIDGAAAFAWNYPDGPDWAEHTITAADAVAPLRISGGPHTIALTFRETTKLDWLELVPRESGKQ